MALMYAKDPRIEIPHLLLLARNQPRPCMLNVSGQCRLPGRRAEGQCVACHGNSAAFGKARGIKAHDFFSVWGCAWCHAWLDSSYVASGEEREQAFKIALNHQIIQWSAIAEEPTRKTADLQATRLALAYLAERGYARQIDLSAIRPKWEPTYASF
jgi:hypothetical protein